MENPRRPMSSKTRAKIRAAKAAKQMPVAILLTKKAECDKKALKIVEMMTETNVDITWMLENLGLLNRSHMEDIVEERAIVKLCGYPLCDNPLTKVINKRYSISTLKNKVYDIEKTKNYCSHKCYLSTEYLMKQMLTSPLWLREEELDIKPEFKLLDNKKKRGSSPPGVEVKLVKLDLPDDSDGSESSDEQSEEKNSNKTEQKPGKRSIDTPVNEILKNDEKEEGTKENNNCRVKKLKKTVSFGKNEVREFEPVDKNVGNEREYSSSGEEEEDWIEFREDEDLRETMEKMIIDDEDNGEKKKEETVQPSTKKPKESPKNPEPLKKSRKSRRLEEKTFETLVGNVEKCVSEWITEETSALLHVESSKTQLVEKLKREEVLKVLCKKLAVTKIEEERENRMEESNSFPVNPVPDFSTLQDKSKDLELKVRAFYQGNLEIVEKNVENIAGDDKKEEKIDSDDAMIPLIDAHNAPTLRRRIFMDKLNRVVPDILKTLAGPDYYRFLYTPDRATNVKALVHTFQLSASNITFKTAEWTLVALLIIKMLSAIDQPIRALLETKKASLYIAMILSTYKLSPNYIDVLISSLTTPRI